MAIMDFFKPTTPAAATVAPVAPVNPNVPAVSANTPVGPDGKMPGTNQVPVNPLDAYSKLYDNANKGTEVAPTFALEGKVLDEVSNSLDFTGSVAPELMQKALSGDGQALLQIMNHVGQQAYKTSLNHGTHLTDKFVNARSSYDLKAVGSRVKSELTNSALSSAPNYEHPVVRQELMRVANAMQSQNPDSTPQQIADAAKQYVTDLYSAINPVKPDAAKEKADAGTDWNEYFKK